MMAVFVLLVHVFTFADAADEAAAAAARASLERMQALRKERPGDGVLVFYEALLRTSLGEREAAFALLRSLKDRKLGLIPARDTGFDAVWDDPKFQAIRKELADEEPATTVSPVAFRLKDPKLIPEGIAFDAVGNRFFVGSIAQHKMIVTDPKGEARDFSTPSDKLDTVLGLAVDSAHGHLYAVSTNGFEESAKTERRNAVVRYDLKEGRLTDRFAAPEATQLNDLAVAPDGTLYVTDSQTGSLFRKKPDETALTRFGETGALRGANGIALGGDGTLYVTLSTGIARVDRATGEPTRLPQPDTVVTGGCDGLYWHDGDLLGIQNSTNPGRVVRIALTEKGTRIEGLTVLQSHHHSDFDEPTTGAIANGALHVIGNSYVSHYQPDSSIKNVEDLKGTAIIAVPLRAVMSAGGTETKARVTTIRKITAIENAYPDWSPDGSKMVFQSNRTGKFQIHVMSADGTNVVRITNNNGADAGPHFSPDGAKIVFTSERDGNPEIYVMNADGTEEKRLTNNPADDSHPNWSPDSTRIIFNSNRDTPDAKAGWWDQYHDLYSMKIDGSDVRKITNCRTVCTFGSWSPDGKKIAYRKVIKTPGFYDDAELTLSETNSEVFVADAGGKNEVNLSKSAAYDAWPAWTPDSKHIIFASNRAVRTQLYVVDVDGSDLARLIDDTESEEDARARPSRDGKKLAFTRAKHGTMEIYTCDLNLAQE